MPPSSTSTYGFDMANQNNNLSNNINNNLTNVKTAAAPRSAMTLGKAKKGDVMSKVQKEMGYSGAAPNPSLQPTSNDAPMAFNTNDNLPHQAPMVNTATLANDANPSIQNNSPVVISVL